MKIVAVEVSRENLELTRPYSIAYKTVDSVENIIVKLQLEDGSIGWGAANPSKYVVGVDNDITFKSLSQEHVNFLIGKDIRCFVDLLETVYVNFAGDAGAKVALDVALHDAFTQYLGVPVAAYYGQKIRRLPTSVTIGIKGIDETLEEAKEFLDAGFKILKVKLGKSLAEDIERLMALRKTYGSSPLIRIDANQGWTKSETLAFFQQTGELNIELVEQPIKADQIQQLTDLPEKFKKLITADESLIDASDAAALTKEPLPAGIFNIKLMKCGGIFEAKKIAEIAKRAGVELMWGCNDESIISISAALHTALTCPNTKYLDLDGSFDLAKDVVTGGFFLEDGFLSLSGRPGLGVSAI